jgi:hypothetical protein
MLALMGASGCVTNYEASSRDLAHIETASPGAKPASAKWEGPWMDAAVGRSKATFYYGPWQCNRKWMDSCQRECAAEGHALMGCMWLADIKYEYQGRILTPVEAGTRYALWHCCCDYPTLTPVQKRPLRERWDAKRDALRKKWAEVYGDWPKSRGVNWPGHHMRDLFHGGDPIDLANIVPAPPDVHDVFNAEYPQCYGGGAPWNAVGPDLPYKD